MNKFYRTSLKVLLWIIGGLIGLILLAFILIRIPAVQNYAVQKVVNYLETKIGTKVQLAKVSLDLPKLLVLEGVYFEDQKQDTLFAGDTLKVDISLLKLLNNKVEINELDFRGITAHINRYLPDSAYNFDYIIRAFVTEDIQNESKDTSAAMAFSIDKINLDRINIVFDDEVIGTNAQLHLGHLDTRIKTFDLQGMFFEIPKIKVEGLRSVIKQWAVTDSADKPSTADMGVEKAVDEDQATDIRVGTLDLKNFDIQYDDAASAMNAKVLFKRLMLDFNELNLPKELVDINKLLLEDADASLILSKAQSSDTETDSASTEELNWVVKAKSIDLKRNQILYDDNTAPTLAKGIDFNHLDLSNLELGLGDFFFSMDSISGDLKELRFKDKSSFEVKRLQSKFNYTDRGVALNDLYLETPNTLIRDRIVVSYPSLERIDEHLEEIVLDVSIRNSKLGMRDALLLVPSLDTIDALRPLLNKTFQINSDINGSLNRLNIPNLQVSTLNNTRLLIAGTIQGAPDMDRMNLNLRVKELRSTRRDLESLIDKSLLPDSIMLPERILLTGNLRGSMSDFDTQLSLSSSIGNAALIGKFSLGNADTLYNAKLNIDDFDLGTLMQDTSYGKIDIAAQVDGKSLDPKNAVADLQVHLKRADFMGYSYSDINLNAQAAQGDILASLVSNDPNLRLKGSFKADMRQQYPSVDLAMAIDSVKLKDLNFTEDDIKYHGQLTGNFDTADPDYLNGYLYITNSVLAYNGEIFPVDSISLISEAEQDRKLITLESEFLNAHVIGNYTLTELPIAIQDAIMDYYNPEQTVIDKKYSPQAFEFSAELIRSPLIRNLIPDLTEMNNVSLDGNFSSENRSLNARLAAPHILYNNILIDTVVFDINTADTTIFYAGRIAEIKAANAQIINTLISGTVKDNLLDFGLWIRDSIDKEQYYIGADLLAQRNNFVFNLKPDGLVLNYDKWTINPDNQIHFGQNGIFARDFILTNDGQSLSLTSQDSSLNAPIDAQFTNFRIETFTRFIETNTFKLGGGINGTVHLDRLESDPTFVTDLTVNQFYFGQDTIGDISMNVDNKRENIYTADINIMGRGNDIDLKGDFVNPPNGSSSLNFVLDLKNLNMTTIEAFSFGNLQHSDGSLKGQLAIKGSTEAPLINGDILFDRAQTNVSMLNALFLFDQQKINFNDNGLRFNRFEVADSTGNKAVINGTISTKTYTDFLMDLSLTANNFQVVNSTARDNDLFYGDLFITSNLNIKGTADNPNVSGTLKVNENTNFSVLIPDENPGMVDREGIVEFVDKRNEQKMQVFAAKDTVATPRLVGMDISVNIEVDPKATFNIIIDPGSGDAVTARGKADLSAGIDPSGKITLAGTYEVSEGSYNLSFNFLNRKFDFRKGSTITWNGDPLIADLDITADYLISTAPIDLVENQLGDQNKNLFKEKLPFQVNLFIQGEMMKPHLSFGIDVNEENANVSQDVMNLVETRLAQISEDESELNKQVFALIALGRFVAENPFSSSAGGSVESMARESVSKLLSAQLNKLAGDLIAGVELNFDLESTDDYSTGTLQNRTDLNVGVSKRMLDDRLKVTVGSNFELEGANQPGRQATNIAGDISVEYQLSRDGRYLLRAYRKNEYEVTLQGQIIETGIGFVINMDYDDFQELFLGSKALERYKRRKERRDRRKYLMRQSRERQRSRNNEGIYRNRSQEQRNEETTNEE